MKHELHQMRAQGSGAIVNCSSLGGLVGLPGRAAEIAAALLWLCSPAASFMLGVPLPVDGGDTAR